MKMSKREAKTIENAKAAALAAQRLAAAKMRWRQRGRRHSGGQQGNESWRNGLAAMLSAAVLASYNLWQWRQYYNVKMSMKASLQ